MVVNSDTLPLDIVARARIIISIYIYLLLCRAANYKSASLVFGERPERACGRYRAREPEAITIVVTTITTPLAGDA